MDDSEYFSGNNPSLLVNDDVIDNINGKLDVEDFEGGSLGKTIKGVYTNFIAPNMFFFIVFFLLAIFLFIRYLIKKDKDSKKKEYEDITDELNIVPNRKPSNNPYNDDKKHIIRNKKRRNHREREIDEEEIEDEFTIRDEDFMTDTSDLYTGDTRDTGSDTMGDMDYVDDIRDNRTQLQDGQMDKIFRRTFLMDQNSDPVNDDFLPYNS